MTHSRPDITRLPLVELLFAFVRRSEPGPWWITRDEAKAELYRRERVYRLAVKMVLVAVLLLAPVAMADMLGGGT